MKIGIQQSNPFPQHIQGYGEINRYGTLTNPSLARQHDNLVPNTAETRLKLLAFREFLLAFIVFACGCRAIRIPAASARALVTR
jgi:hypothetical protein